MTFVDPIGKFRWIVGRGIFMEGNQSAYYGQYYIPLQNLEQEILQWLRKLVDAYAKQAGETPVEHCGISLSDTFCGRGVRYS